jgi:uncharacterized membrane protein YkvA (DUF1232 family)
MTQQNGAKNTGNGMGSAALEQLAAAARLMMDGRVPFTLKLLLPAAAALYWFWPIDLMPGLPFDDVAIVIGALMLFVKLASDAVARADAQKPEAGPKQGEDGPVVDTTWRVVK